MYHYNGLLSISIVLFLNIHEFLFFSCNQAVSDDKIQLKL